MLFEDLSLSKVPKLSKAILFYSHSRTINTDCIIRQRFGCAQTGTGKTGAFAIPIIHQLHRCWFFKESKTNMCLSNATRELAVQIGQSFDTYAKYTNLTQHVLVEYHKIHK
jgi:ATP-dependent RNA helicase RhlE